MLIKALMFSLEHQDQDPDKQANVMLWRDDILRACSEDLESKSLVMSTLSYSTFCNKPTCIISDLSTGLRNGSDQWITIRQMLRTSDRFAHLEQISLGADLDWENVRELLIQKLQQSNIDESFHLFWSLDDDRFMSIDELLQQFDWLAQVVELIVSSGRTPYLCLDMQSLERPEFQKLQDREKLTAIFAKISDSGALIERSNVFWRERRRLPVAMDSLCDTKEEVQVALQSDVDYQLLIQFLEKSILRQKAIIELSLPKLSSSIPARNKTGEWYIDRAIKNLLDWHGPKYAELSGIKNPTLEIAHGTTGLQLTYCMPLNSQVGTRSSLR